MAVPILDVGFFMPNKKETCVNWLERTSRIARGVLARRKATEALETWEALLESWKERGVKTRRSLWDILAGTKEVAGHISHTEGPVTIISGDKSFTFPVFAEACEYRGRTTPACAITTGVYVIAHRVPQDGKWGNTVLKT